MHSIHSVMRTVSRSAILSVISMSMFLFLFMFHTPIGLADVPRQLSLQGTARSRLTGVPLDDVFAVTFTLYETSGASAIPLWTETQNVSFEGGRYQVVLGAEPTNPLFLGFPYDDFSLWSCNFPDPIL